jgi:serine/threonine-protein kinase
VISRSVGRILPGGRTILITIGTSASYDNARVAVFDRVKRSVRVLVNGATAGRYVPTGHLVYVRGGTGAGGTLFAAPFDLKRLAITGPAEPVIEGIFYNAGGGYADYAFSDSGLSCTSRRPARPISPLWSGSTAVEHPSTPACRRGDMPKHG